MTMKRALAFLAAVAFAVLSGISVLAQSASPGSPTQIGPGKTGSISPTQGVTPASGDKAKSILNGALTPQTRQTLQDAMNSVPAPSH